MPTEPRHNQKEVNAMLKQARKEVFDHFYALPAAKKAEEDKRRFGSAVYGAEHKAAAEDAADAVEKKLRSEIASFTGSLDKLRAHVVDAVTSSEHDQAFMEFTARHSANKAYPTDGIGADLMHDAFDNELAQSFRDSVVAWIKEAKVEERAEQAAVIATQRQRLARISTADASAPALAVQEGAAKQAVSNQNPTLALEEEIIDKRLEAAASEDAPERARQAVLDSHKQQEARAVQIAAETRAAAVAAEKVRADAVKAAAVAAQLLEQQTRSAVAVQRVVRGRFGRKKTEDLQKEKAAIHIQKVVRDHLSRKKAKDLEAKHAAQDAFIEKILESAAQHLKQHIAPTPKTGWAWWRALITLRSRAHEQARDGAVNGMIDIARAELTKLMRSKLDYDMNDHGKLKRQVINNLTAQTAAARKFLDDNSKAKTGVRSGISADAAKAMFVATFKKDSVITRAVESSIHDVHKREAEGRIAEAVSKHGVQLKAKRSASLKAAHEKVADLSTHIDPRPGQFHGAYTEQHKGAMEAVDQIVQEKTKELLHKKHKGQKIDPRFIKQILGRKLETEAVKACIQKHLNDRPTSRLRDTGCDESRESFLKNDRAVGIIKAAVEEAVNAASAMSHRAKGHGLEARARTDALEAAAAKKKAYESDKRAAAHKKTSSFTKHTR